MILNNAYESKDMTCVLGDTLRPGGFELTDKGVEFCSFSEGNKILDIGCGRGATVEYLEQKFLLNSFGIDPSKVLLKEGKSKNPKLKIEEGIGEAIPFENESMNGIFAECTLSLMEVEKTIKEVHRVLKKQGFFIITDVYAKNPEYVKLLDEFSFNSCMRGLHDLEKLKNKLEDLGFKIVLFEDYTELLKQLMVKIIFSYGSMNVFWSKAASCSNNCLQFQEVLSKCKVGYFLLIAKKEIE
jgi:arsenite methyltransferase